MSEEQDFRDSITADFKAGEIGIENGWLVEYNDPCPSPCAGAEYGCPPSCLATPLVDLWSASQRGVVAEEPEWGIAHVATPWTVWPLSEDRARETAAIEPDQWIIYSRPKTVTHEWVPVKQEGAE